MLVYLFLLGGQKPTISYGLALEILDFLGLDFLWKLTDIAQAHSQA